MKHRWQLYNRWQRRFTAPSPHAKGFLIFIMVSIAGLLASISAMVPDERIESWLLQRIPRAWQHAESQSKMGWWSVGGEENTASSFKLTYGLFNIPGKPFRQNLALAEAVLIAETPDPRALKAIRGGNEVERADAIKGISGLDLMGRNFRYGDMQRAILVSADLRNADLRGANLREADLGQVDASQTSLFSVNLENARLDGANLSYANLQGADLFAADLRSANLTGANLRSAQLEEADLRGALGLEKRRIQEANNWLLAYYNSTTLKELGLPQNHNERVKSKYFLNYQLPFANMIGSSLSMADLDGANLNRAVLDNSILIRASLKGGQLKNASLRKANLEEADLTKADLTDANLTGAFLPGSIFVEATLTRANLENTWLGGVHFQGARLDGANLKNATLSGASLMGATLKNADLSGAKLYSSGSGPESLGAAIVTFDQLSEVETLCNAQLEQEIRLQVEQKRPDLLCR